MDEKVKLQAPVIHQKHTILILLLIFFVSFMALVTLITSRRISQKQSYQMQSEAKTRRSFAPPVPTAGRILYPDDVNQQETGCNEVLCSSATNGRGRCIRGSVGQCNTFGGLAYKCSVTNGSCQVFTTGTENETCCVLNWNWGGVDSCTGLNKTQCNKANKTGALECTWHSCINKCVSGSFANEVTNNYKGCSLFHDCLKGDFTCSVVNDCLNRSVDDCARNDLLCKLVHFCGDNGETKCVPTGESNAWARDSFFCPLYNKCASISSDQECRSTSGCEVSSCGRCKASGRLDEDVCPIYK